MSDEELHSRDPETRGPESRGTVLTFHFPLKTHLPYFLLLKIYKIISIQLALLHDIQPKCQIK